jgi:hypothetical protein
VSSRRGDDALVWREHQQRAYVVDVTHVFDVIL